MPSSRVEVLHFRETVLRSPAASVVTIDSWSQLFPRLKKERLESAKPSTDPPRGERSLYSFAARHLSRHIFMFVQLSLHSCSCSATGRRYIRSLVSLSRVLPDSVRPRQKHKQHNSIYFDNFFFKLFDFDGAPANEKYAAFISFLFFKEFDFEAAPTNILTIFFFFNYRQIYRTSCTFNLLDGRVERGKMDAS